MFAPLEIALNTPDTSKAAVRGTALSCLRHNWDT
jgi:hypothetical protein